MRPISNTALATNSSMILRLQGKTPVSSAPDSVRNKIQFIKDSGTYSCDFTIRAASPTDHEHQQHAASAWRDRHRVWCQFAGDRQGDIAWWLHGDKYHQCHR